VQTVATASRRALPDDQLLVVGSKAFCLSSAIILNRSTSSGSLMQCKSMDVEIIGPPGVTYTLDFSTPAMKALAKTAVFPVGIRGTKTFTVPKVSRVDIYIHSHRARALSTHGGFICTYAVRLFRYRIASLHCSRRVSLIQRRVSRRRKPITFSIASVSGTSSRITRISTSWSIRHSVESVRTLQIVRSTQRTIQ
jgi:hypothetical protein